MHPNSQPQRPEATARLHICKICDALLQRECGSTRERAVLGSYLIGIKKNAQGIAAELEHYATVQRDLFQQHAKQLVDDRTELFDSLAPLGGKLFRQPSEAAQIGAEQRAVAIPAFASLD